MCSTGLSAAPASRAVSASGSTSPSASPPSTGATSPPSRRRAKGPASCSPCRFPKEARQLRKQLLRLLLGDKVAARQGAAAHVGRHFAPVVEALEQRPDHALLSPQREHRHADLRAVALV